MELMKILNILQYIISKIIIDKKIAKIKIEIYNLKRI